MRRLRQPLHGRGLRRRAAESARVRWRRLPQRGFDASLAASLENSHCQASPRRVRLPLKFPSPRCRSIEIANTSALQHGRIEVGCIDCDRVAGTFLSIPVVCDAPAPLATEVRANPVPPGVLGEAAGRGLDADRAGAEIGPKRAVAATDRAVTPRERPRCSRNMNANGAAMTCRGDLQYGISHSQASRLPFPRLELALDLSE